ncbi:MAG TPA: cupin domain-containing protein [Allosphingosinicella sp.]|jgi:mannose-6-phosphate isomerase-like protein (cupin superfamily)
MFRAYAAGAWLAASVSAAAASPAAEVVPAPRLRAYVARTIDGLVSHPAFADPAAKTMVVRRDGPGEVEVHDRLNDVLVAQAGTAILRVGGRVAGGRETAPGEHRGGTIVGGRSRALHAGDVAWIPAGLPHQLIVKRGGSFIYVVVKTDKAARSR